LPWVGPQSVAATSRPAIEVDLESAQSDEIERTGVTNSEELTPAGEELIHKKPGRVLLVEDSEENITTFSDYLAFKRYEVIVARNGQEAIEVARQIQPDLILMDIQMPEMDGLEATRRLRADPELASIPVIALTALAMPGDQELCFQAGVNDYLSKPVSLKKLAKVVEAYLSQ
jgi:CheY-like chemotaxis protein